ncbi:MAG: P1 family peptidase [Chloroflexota bacterium]|nr:P1 family peptidase [Chloroflexota bacterium]
MSRPTNDDLALEPVIPAGGKRLALDFPGLEIGVAEYAEGPTGCTVIHVPDGAILAVDVRGGSPAWVGDYGWTHAVCLAGGSIHGLEAVAGVTAELFARRDHATGWDQLGLASGAIIYDYRPRDNAIYPDKALGRAALRAAAPGSFPLGRRGAGISATVGKGSPIASHEPSGQGAATLTEGPLRIAFFTVVNAVGAVVDRSGRVVRGYLDPATGDRLSAAAALRAEGTAPPPPGNTTISVLAVNQAMERFDLVQLGRQVHTSMARAIHPFHAPTDGDVLFTLTTGDLAADAPGALPTMVLGVLAADLAWDAVLSAVAD